MQGPQWGYDRLWDAMGSRGMLTEAIYRAVGGSRMLGEAVGCYGRSWDDMGGSRTLGGSRMLVEAVGCYMGGCGMPWEVVGCHGRQ